jgi:guanine nucleotide-binding protein G(i) subunit alpha
MFLLLRPSRGSLANNTYLSFHRQTFAQQILDFQLTPDAEYTLPSSLADAIESVWQDPVMQTVLDHSTEFYLMDSAPYFFAEVRRICDPKYIPNQDDVLRARAKTTGITETRFHMGQLSIQYVDCSSIVVQCIHLSHLSMFDVGGQRSERRKWIHCFESVTSIIFCVAISEYDQVLLEERSQVREGNSFVSNSLFTTDCFVTPEPDARISCSLRVGCEFKMVSQHLHHIIPKQD